MLKSRLSRVGAAIGAGVGLALVGAVPALAAGVTPLTDTTGQQLADGAASNFQTYGLLAGGVLVSGFAVVLLMKLGWSALHIGVKVIRKMV